MATLMAAGDDRLRTDEPAQAPLLYAALGLLLLDVLMRRVRFVDRSFRRGS